MGLSLSLLLSVVTPLVSVAKSSPQDVTGHWAQPCIESLVKKQIIPVSGGKFRPDGTVSRADLATAIDRAFPKVTDVREPMEFVDVTGKYWAAEAIGKAYRRGFLSGYPGGVFSPNKKVERSQAILSLASGLKYAPQKPVELTLNTAFADAASIPNYARNPVAAATEKGIVVNYPDVRSLNLNKKITKGELAAIFCQALETPGLVPDQYIAKATGPSIPALPERSSELRGVWLTNIDSNVLFERDRLNKALQQLKQLNFNTIYPAVWNWGYTLYPSPVAQKVIGTALDPTPGLQGRDILTEMVQTGHQQGLQVIPWFEFGFMAPADSELAKRRPQWLTSRRDGTKIWKEGIHDRVWLNPFRPEVQQFIQDLILEIVRKYDIDGIQFDDHFGLPAELGYDDYTVSLYKKEHGGKAPSSNAQDPEWLKWRADKITAYMKQVFTAIKQVKKDCLVSVAPNPQRFSYDFFLADWEKWERMGLVEELVLQIYRNDLKVFTSELDRPEVQAARRHIPVSIGIITGLKNKPIPMSQIQTQVKTVRDRNFAGVSFFFYESLWNLTNEPSQTRQTALNQLFPTPAKAANLLAGWQSRN